MFPVSFFVLGIATLGAQWTGHDDLWPGLAVGLIVLSLGELVAEWRDHRRRRSSPQAERPALSAQQTGDLRGERERAGEIAAVRRLRKLYPAVSLVEARDLIREL
jgi:hypothetical protein